MAGFDLSLLNDPALSGTVQQALAALNEKPAYKSVVLPTNMPFNQNNSVERDNLIRQLNDYNLNLSAQLNQLNEQVFTTGRRLVEEEPNIRRKTLNNAASRGMARSSGYATQVGEVEKNFANQFSDLSKNYQTQRADWLRQQDAMTENAQYALQRLVQTQAQQNADKARERALQKAAIKAVSV